VETRFRKPGKGRVKNAIDGLGRGAFEGAAGVSPERHVLFENSRCHQCEIQNRLFRNATIGRAKRMGLPGPDRPRNWPNPTLSAEALRLHRLRERLASESSRPMPALESVEPVDLCCVEINPRRLSLLDLEPGDCRYPYGGDEEGEAITFCGHPRRQGTSYCAAHFYLTRRPGAAPERPGATVSLRLVEAA
jgi:GcrA cell cycle regulator